MNKNMGSIDRIIRIILAVVVVFLYYTKTITGASGIVLLVVAGVFAATSILGFCPLYKIIDLNTCGKKNT